MAIGFITGAFLAPVAEGVYKEMNRYKTLSCGYRQYSRVVQVCLSTREVNPEQSQKRNLILGALTNFSFVQPLDIYCASPS